MTSHVIIVLLLSNMNILLVRWRNDRNLFLTTNILPWFMLILCCIAWVVVLLCMIRLFFYWIYAQCTWSEMTEIKLFNQSIIKVTWVYCGCIAGRRSTLSPFPVMNLSALSICPVMKISPSVWLYIIVILLHWRPPLLRTEIDNFKWTSNW